MSSGFPTAGTTTDRAPEATTSAEQLVAGDDNVEADDPNDANSTFDTDRSDSISISSRIYAGYVENGRRYQVTREGEYFMPSDEKQFECMQAAHIIYMILDHAAPNPLSHAPVGDNLQNILDIGTGDGTWAREVADTEENLRTLKSVVDKRKMKADPKLEVKKAATEPVEDEPKAGVKRTNSEPGEVKEKL